jgi:electron transfer flavoprotein beta subunit
MHIVVCVKQVPDSWAEKSLNATDFTLDRAAADGVLNELDEYALEEGLRIAEAHGGSASTGGPHTVTVVSMGPQRATETLRKALAIGADGAVHLLDDQLHGSDTAATARALSAVLATQDADLVIMGSESTDARSAVVPAMMAEILGWPQLTFAASVAVDPQARTVLITRQTEGGSTDLAASLPAVVSVVEKLNEPRYPSFKGIMAAKKKPVTTLSLADIGISPDRVGLAAAWSAVDDAARRPPRAAGVILTDAAYGGSKIAAFLAEEKLL